MQERHLDWEEILEIVNSPASMTALAADVRGHLESCRLCALRVETVRSLETEGRLLEPPRELLERTFARLKARMKQEAGAAQSPAPLEHLQEALREVVAVLTGDSLRAAPAVRGEAVAAPRTLLFETAGYSIALSFAPSETGTGLDLLGQVSPKRASELPEIRWATAQTKSGASGAREAAEAAGTPGPSSAREAAGGVETPISASGHFVLKSVERGIGEVSVRMGHENIRLPLPVLS